MHRHSARDSLSQPRNTLSSAHHVLLATGSSAVLQKQNKCMCLCAWVWICMPVHTCLLSADLLPLDLLSFVLERDTSRLLPGVHMRQAGGVRGVHFSSPHTSMSFPSSQLLVDCDVFPKEFSIVVTLKVSHSAPKVSVHHPLICPELDTSDRRNTQILYLTKAPIPQC